MLHYTPTIVQEIYDNALDAAQIRLLVKREDLNHPQISGNKWWKLKYNLAEAVKQKQKTLLTFGGAYSNHIYATATAAHELGLNSIGIIRGEETLPLNRTLAFASQSSMHLHYVARDVYRKKNEIEFIQQLKRQFGDFYLIPEGGTNQKAVMGCVEWGETLKEIDFDYLCLPVGTGGTIAGIIAALDNEREIIGFPVLKGGEFLQQEIQILLNNYSNKLYGNWQLDASYHHGGYAKVSSALLDFIAKWNTIHNLPLDPVYTGKLLWAVMDYARIGKFRRGATVLALHTGGLQGRG
jgi:1-aminocyclopropane-1-carboxylate deaminase